MCISISILDRRRHPDWLRAAPPGRRPSAKLPRAGRDQELHASPSVKPPLPTPVDPIGTHRRAIPSQYPAGEGLMPAAPRSSLLHGTSLILLALLAACDRPESRTETAGATVPASSGTIPITAASEDARRLYLQGRGLTENLRAHDGRKLYHQAVEADP